MADLSEGIFEEGFEKGGEKGFNKYFETGWKKTTLKFIRNLMETMNVNAQQAFEMLKIPESDRSEYLKEL